MEKYLSNSVLQKEMEVDIIEAVSIHLKTKSILLTKPLKESRYSFHFDFHDIEAGVIGEIYSCAFPLKPGHIRKIKSDLLKMITFEKLRGSSLKKIMVLTVSSSYIKDVLGKTESHPEKSITPHTEEFKVLTNNSWMMGSIDSFKTEILYYVLSSDQDAQLNKTRINQAKGIIKKIEGKKA